MENTRGTAMPETGPQKEPRATVFPNFSILPISIQAIQITMASNDSRPIVLKAPPGGETI
jgi:hypothetical protein